MLATKKEMERNIHALQGEIRQVRDRNWELWHKYELLLKHFGLTEHTTPETTELRTKGSPERGA